MLPGFRSLPALGIGLLIATALAGCGGGEPEASAWVGQVSDSDAVVALVRDDTAIRAYVCGGATTYAMLSRWLDGEADEAGGFEATQGGWAVAGEIDDEAASGTIRAASGELLVFTASPIAGDDGLPGLYVAETPGCRTGVVVGSDAAGATWLQGTWCDGAGHFEQVTPVLPIERGDLGIRVAVDLTTLGQGKLDLYAVPARAR